VTILVSDDRFVSFSEVDARIGEVCFGPTSGLRQSGLSGPKSANNDHQKPTEQR
jgi:hypothetical protein